MKPDITDKLHPINVFKSLGKYDATTGYIPNVEGKVITLTQDSVEVAHGEVVPKKPCNSCGGGKVR